MKYLFPIAASFSLLLLSCKDKPKTSVPNFSAKFFNGDTINLQNISRNKIMLVNIWSTLCGPCLEEIPTLQKIHKEYESNKNILFVTIALNKEDELRQFTTSKDTSNIHAKVFKHSGIKRFSLPVLVGLRNGYKVTASPNGSFIAIFDNKKEVSNLQKLFNFQGIPTTILYDRTGKIIYYKTGKITTEHFLTEKIDSLLAL